MVVVPPAKTVAPPATTAVGTLVSLALLMTNEPASFPLLACELRMKIGVLVTSASMMAWPPVVCKALEYHNLALLKIKPT